MLDIQFIRENPDKVKKACRAKNVDPEIVDSVLKTDEERIGLIKTIEELRQGRNKLTRDQVEKGREIKSKLKKLEPKLRETREKFQKLIYQIPNPPANDVKIGKNEKENTVVKVWGKKPKFDFQPYDHLSLADNLDLIDVRRAGKVSGPRFGYLKNEAVLLEFALIQYGLRILSKHGFIPVIPPVLIKSEMMEGMGYLDHGGDSESYHLDKDNLYLVGTSEQSIGPMHADEVLLEKKLPLRYASFSTCFRRESGSYGKDTKGVFRVHQFDKLEMLSFSKPEDSNKEHEFLLSIEEKLVQDLKLPYQLIKMCSGDLGHPAARKYDIECWFPSQKKYRETHSVSTCTDFQSRRLNIKYRKKTNGVEFLHMLNGTFFAQRLIIAILENYQQRDGSVEVPKVLQKYVGSKVIKRG